MLLNEDWLGVESLLALSTFVVKGRGRNEEINKERDTNTKKRGKKRGYNCMGFYWDANQSFKWLNLNGSVFKRHLKIVL